MATYTLITTATDGHQHQMLADFEDDQAIIADVKHVLTREHPSVAIAKGVGDELEYLGVWDLTDEGPVWTPDE